MPNPDIDRVFGTGQKKKNRENFLTEKFLLTEQKSAVPVYKLPVLLS